MSKSCGAPFFRRRLCLGERVNRRTFLKACVASTVIRTISRQSVVCSSILSITPAGQCSHIVCLEWHKKSWWLAPWGSMSLSFWRSAASADLRTRFRHASWRCCVAGGLADELRETADRTGWLIGRRVAGLHLHASRRSRRQRARRRVRSLCRRIQTYAAMHAMQQIITITTTTTMTAIAHGCRSAVSVLLSVFVENPDASVGGLGDGGVGDGGAAAWAMKTAEWATAAVVASAATAAARRRWRRRVRRRWRLRRRRRR